MQSLQPLYDAIKDVGASHNSPTRHPWPRCHPHTRRGILNTIHRWIHSTFSEDYVFWLYGPAGVGKSAIAQTVAEIAQKEGYLASSFFFSRSDAKRNTVEPLLLTIAYELATSISELRGPIGQAIQRNPNILLAPFSVQLTELIVAPCMTLKQVDDHPWLIIIDNLDDCIRLQYVLPIIATAMAALGRRIRLRILTCSRPEPWIRAAFDNSAFRLSLRRVALDDTFNPGHDIAIFLNTEFERIRTSPRYSHIRLPMPWPSHDIVEKLIKQASGQFMYAATVIKFVDNEFLNPCDQLEIILNPDRDSGSPSPLHKLDLLYHQILSSDREESKPNLRDIIDIIHAIVLHRSPTPRSVGALLMLHEEGVISCLRGMHSILDIGGPDDTIRVIFGSFDDFIRDRTRSGQFFIGDKQEQHEFLASYLLRAINYYLQISNGDTRLLSPAQYSIFREAWSSWGYHCSESNLSDTVLNALRAI